MNIVGDSSHLIFENSLMVANNQTNKGSKPWTGKRPPLEETAAPLPIYELALLSPTVGKEVSVGLVVWG